MTETKLADESPRTCATCACSKIQKHPQLANVEQIFCRRDPINAAKVRVERAMINSKTKEPMFERDGKTPRTEIVEELGYMHRPVIATETCFDGWRPLGTLPGDKWTNARLDSQMAELLFAGFRKLSADMLRDSLLSIEPEIDGGEGTH